MKRDYTRHGWAEVPAVVIASGPSLTDEQLQVVRDRRERCHTIAVNNTCGRAWWADCAYFGDYLALREYVPKLRAPVGPFTWHLDDNKMTDLWLVLTWAVT